MEVKNMDGKRIGFIGLGEMGYPMSVRLFEAGHKIYTSGHSKSPKSIEKLGNLKKKGFFIEASFYEVAEKSEIIITILPADKELREVLLDTKFMKSIKKNTIIIDMTSCASATIKEIGLEYKKLECSVIDAPVSGGILGAEKGTLAILASGAKEDVEEVNGILEILGNKIIYVGELGKGKAIKSVNQMMVGLNTIAFIEAYSAGLKQGLEPELIYEVIKKSSGYSDIFDRKFKNVSENKFDEGFKLKHMRKDLRVALESSEGVPLPFSKLAHEFYLMAQEYDEMDFTAISKLFVEAFR
jgi:3-hydroxyisobutyrate dehydrogenase-like beta-hydroxyacid dehydrogenase